MSAPKPNRNQPSRNQPKRSQSSKGSSGGVNGRGSKNGGSANGRYFFALRVPDAVAARLAEEQGGLRGNWRRVEAGHMHITLAYLPRVQAARVPELKRLGVEAANTCPPLDLQLRGTGYFPNQGSPRVWFVKVEELPPRAERVATVPEQAEGREQRAKSNTENILKTDRALFTPSPLAGAESLQSGGAAQRRGMGGQPNELTSTQVLGSSDSDSNAEASALAALAQSLRAGISALELATDDKPFKAHITLARKKGPAPRVPPIVFEGQEWQARHLYLIRSTLRKTGPIYETVSRFELRGVPAKPLTDSPLTDSPPNH